MVKKANIYFRTDGNVEIGYGHVIRSLALAEMVSAEFDCYFIIKNPNDFLRDQINKICKSLIEVPENLTYEEEVGQLLGQYLGDNTIFVIDSYNVQEAYHQSVKATGSKLVCIDDLHSFHHIADVVINHASGKTSSDYSTEPYTKLCLGTHWAMVRKSFRESFNKNEAGRKKENIFVCLGGSKVNQLILETLQLIKKETPESHVKIVMGNAQEHRTELLDYIEESNLAIETYSGLNEQEMAALMQKCGKAITTPSTVSYEYLSLGGELYVKQIADNQQGILDFFRKEKLAFELEEFPVKNEVQIQQSLGNQKQHFDNRQAKRFTRLFLTLLLKANKATANQCDLYLEWANEDTVRHFAINKEKIPYDSHVKWYHRKIDDPDTMMLWFEINQQPVGQVRMDTEEDHWIIGYSIDPAWRGKGLGKELLQKAMEITQKEKPGKKRFIGKVSPDNPASVKCFENLQYSRLENEMIKGTEYLVFEKQIH